MKQMTERKKLGIYNKNILSLLYTVYTVNYLHIYFGD